LIACYPKNDRPGEANGPTIHSGFGSQLFDLPKSGWIDTNTFDCFMMAFPTPMAFRALLQKCDVARDFPDVS